MLTSEELDKKNRRDIESKRIKEIASIEAGPRKDTLKKIDSGFNHVMANRASKNNVQISIEVHELRKLEIKEKAQRLARIRYNLAIGRKEKVSFKVKGADKEAQPILLSLGASTEQTRQ